MVCARRASAGIEGARGARVLGVLAAASLAACDGLIGEPGQRASETPSGPSSPTRPGEAPAARPPRAPRYRCDEGATPAELPLRRLTSTQLSHTLSARVRAAAPRSAAAVLSALAPALSLLPVDAPVHDEGTIRGGQRRLAQDVQQQHIDGLYDVGQALGAALTTDAGRVAEVFGACAADTDTSNDASCLQNFVRTFPTRAFRRPVADADVQFLASAAAPLPIALDGLANVAALVVDSPEFFYLPEHGAAGDTAAVVPLDAHELAARLAYQFRDAPPDEALLEAARTGALLDDDGFVQQVERLANDPRADAAFAGFFHDWLRLDDVADTSVQVGRPAFDAFAGGERPTAALRQAMIDDVLGAARFDLRHGRSLSDLLGDRGAYTRDPLLARIYGTSAWDGTSAAPIPSGSRAGCHATMINPLGFATEGFDALGRARTMERTYGADGAPTGEHPVDTRVVAQVIAGDTSEASNAVDLTRLLDESGRVHSCLAREYFRCTFQRPEAATTDGCARTTTATRTTSCATSSSSTR